MTEFKRELRHRCRNPKCRSKLPAPVANEREAFCARGCHGGFYRKRCLVCEAPMERKTEHQLVCGKRKCRNALKANIGFGRYHAPSNVVSGLKTPIKPGMKSGLAAATSHITRKKVGPHPLNPLRGRGTGTDAHPRHRYPVARARHGAMKPVGRACGRKGTDRQAALPCDTTTADEERACPLWASLHNSGQVA
jgi:hypothetical protein